MEFCPKCGAMMLPKDGILKCNSCGYDESLSDAAEEYAVSGTIKESETVKDFGEDFDIGQGINEVCPECGNDRATYKL